MEFGLILAYSLSAHFSNILWFKLVEFYVSNSDKTFCHFESPLFLINLQQALQLFLKPSRCTLRRKLGCNSFLHSRRRNYFPNNDLGGVNHWEIYIHIHACTQTQSTSSNHCEAQEKRTMIKDITYSII